MDLSWLSEGAKVLAPVASLAASSWTLLNTARILLAQKKREKMENTPISIVLMGESDYVLPYKPLRKTLSRAEVMGVLGMAAPGQRIVLSSLNDVFVGGSFDQVLSGKTDVLIIPVSQAEMLQFTGF